MQFRTIRSAMLCGALLSACDALAQGAERSVASNAGDDLLGLWGAEPLLGPQVRGQVLLSRSGRRWTLRTGGFEAEAMQTGDSVIIALPGGQGTMRAWNLTRSPEAYWIQPPGMSAAYALPVPLRAADSVTWVGMITPVDAQFPLYLAITRDSGGRLRAMFRNPALNWPGRVPSYEVARDGESVSFVHPKTGKVQWRQPYDSARRTITFDFGAPIVLSPRSIEQAVGFVARSPALHAYAYRTPAPLDDGWPVRHASRVTLDTVALRTIVRDLAAADPVSISTPRIHSLLVARRGHLVLEEYFHGHASDVMHDLRSASKTMTSVMVGAAIHRGTPLSAATPVRGGPITLAHLLSHSSGKACDDDDDASPGNEDTMQSQSAQPDWYEFFMALPSRRAPGTAYVYCSAGVNMAGQVIGAATRHWLPRFFDAALARPMQIHRWGMNLMPSGEAYAGGGLHLTPRDLLKFGQLYLDGGIWRGKRLVSPLWVRESIAHHIDRPDGSDDGLGWHRHLLSVGTRRYQTYEASGNGGQFLLVVPDLDLAIVATAGNYGEYPVWQQIRERLIPAVIAAAR